MDTCENSEGCPYNDDNHCTMRSVLAGDQWCDSFVGDQTKPWTPANWTHLTGYVKKRSETPAQRVRRETKDLFKIGDR